MFIILDYDETYAANPALWDAFIQLAKSHSAEIVCCSMRVRCDSYNEDIITAMAKHDIPIVYAALHKDKWAAMQDAGYQPENAIWIDDRPMFIYLDRSVEEWQEL